MSRWLKPLRSLQGRIALACALLASVSTAAAMLFVSTRLTVAAEADLQRELQQAAHLVERQQEALLDRYAVTARLVADLPKLKAAVGTRDAPTVEPIALEYQQQIGADVFLVLDAEGTLLGGSAPALTPLPSLPAMLPAAASGEASSVSAHTQGLLQVVHVPITLGLDPPERLGSLVLGYLLDQRRAEELKTLTGADIAFVANGEAFVTTLGPALAEALDVVPAPAQTSRLRIAGEEYEVLVQRFASTPVEEDPLRPASVATSRSVADLPHSGTAALVLKSRTERMQTLGAIQRALAGVGVATVLVTVAVSLAVARRLTQPVNTLSAHMRHVAASGDVTRKVTMPPPTRWDDDDARVLAAAFNALTDAVDGAQKQAAQRERLSSLGRMSSIIAHEIRNPLMIIKGALRQLSRGSAQPADIREAAADIDGEVQRLDRLVTGVLDIARPLRFEYTLTDINGLCRAVARTIDPSVPVTLDLDPQLAALRTDEERLRTVLVNLLTNASQALSGKQLPIGEEAFPSRPARITLRTRAIAGGGVEIAVEDSGSGIAASDLPRVFDPFFTTRRTGTGLGLPIAKNIVDGLGGTLGVTSVPGVGTEFRITFPAAVAAA